jgi:hypothetical protein
VDSPTNHKRKGVAYKFSHDGGASIYPPKLSSTL